MCPDDEAQQAGSTARGEILIVDDSPSALSFLAAKLSEAGYRVREAPSGELALWTVKARLPDLILLDIRMPEMDGFEVCRRLKADPATARAPVVFLSAQGETADKVQGLKVGAVDFITKNFQHDEIFARIDTHVALSRIQLSLENERANLELRIQARTQELVQGKNLLHNIIDSGPDWIYALGRDFRIMLVNSSLANAFGFPDCASLVGKMDCEVFPHAPCPECPEDRLCLPHDEERRVLEGQTVHKVAEPVTLPGGKTLYFETYKTPLTDASGIISGILCYRRDVTQRLSMENDKRALERELFQAKKMEAIGKLAGGIAHDFNHMLSLILGFAEFAKKALASGKTEKLDDYLTEIMRAGTSGQEIVAQVLAYSRANESPGTPSDIAAWIEETVGSVNHAYNEGKVVTSRVSANLPKVAMKPVQLKQILTNLILNARDAVSSGEQILVTCEQQAVTQPHSCQSCRKEFEGNFVLLSVTDDGEGISRVILDNIFDPFFTTKDVGKGSGLGLAMVHGITHAVGGHIEIETAIAKGTSVKLWFPVAY